MIWVELSGDDGMTKGEACSIPERAQVLIEHMTQPRLHVVLGNPTGYGMKLTNTEIAQAVKNYKAEEDEMYKSWKADCLD